MRVYMAQLLCPARHCILAAVKEYADDTAAQVLSDTFSETVNIAVASEIIDPKCGVCASSDLRIEVSRTAFKSLDEASGPLRDAERAREITAAVAAHNRRVEKAERD